jgi:kumamolisin
MAVKDTEKEPLPGVKVVGPANPQEAVEVTVRVRGRNAAQLADRVRQLGQELPGQRKHMTHDEYDRAHGADPADLDKVAASLGHYGLKVITKDVARRSVDLSGTVAQMEAAFNVKLNQYRGPSGEYRGREGPVSVPADIHSIVEHVTGLDNRPAARPHFRILKPGAQAAGGAAASPHAVGPHGFNPNSLAQIYNFPPNTSGKNQTVAIIELGGGFRAPEMQAYFTGLGINPAPAVSAVSAGAQNTPGLFNNNPLDPKNADGEVVLDIQVVGAAAPGTNIVVYFAPNTSKGFLNAITQAIHDKANNPSVISISWGGPELPPFTTKAQMKQMDQAFQAAAALGITVCIAAGDNGSDDGVGDGRAHADFPSSSPFALACGGTRLITTGNTINSETVWFNTADGGSTGGGISDYFQRPAYQSGTNIPNPINGTLIGGKFGRGLPDVSATADPASGYNIHVDGQALTFGGTSAVAPLWAALIARLNQALGHRVGYLNPLLYTKFGPANVCRDITGGSNDLANLGGYSAAKGWDACTGWGSPNGVTLLQALSGTLPAATGVAAGANVGEPART